LFRDQSSLQSFQIELHEYGISPDNNKENCLLGSHDEDKKEDDDRIRVVYEPTEFGTDRYRGEQLIFSEIMSSTKVFLTHNVETKEVSII